MLFSTAVRARARARARPSPDQAPTKHRPRPDLEQNYKEVENRLPYYNFQISDLARSMLSRPSVDPHSVMHVHMTRASVTIYELLVECRVSLN